jgi:hypothetical protein
MANSDSQSFRSMQNILTNHTLNSTREKSWWMRSRWIVPVSVIVLFAAGVLHFARIEWFHPPADQRVNDGEEPTFFAFHILPSFNFSEDFYLYHVRAKRIAQRGWSDSLFYSRPTESTNFAAPLQVGLSQLAVMTDGRPVAYSLYMFVILATAWIALYAAARSWLPSSVHTASILAAVLLAVLFESTHYLVTSPEYPTFGQWPMFRSLRMSTMSWTSPLLVASLLCLSSLAVDHERWRGRIVLLLGMLLLLAGTDNWAFGLAWFAGGLATAWIGLELVVKRWWSGAWSKSGLACMCGLAAVVLCVFLLHEQLNGSLHGDVLLRAGFGPEWSNSIRRAESFVTVREWLNHQGVFPIVAVLFGSWIVIRPSTEGRLPLKLARQTPDTGWVQIRWLVLLPLIAMLVMYEVLKLRGMEPFLQHQLFWRLNFCLLFVFALATLEWWRAVLTTWLALRHANLAKSTTSDTSVAEKSLTGSRLRAIWRALRPRTWGASLAVAIALLFVYHNYRIDWFVRNIAAQNFFLTADAEKLRSWLEEYEREHGRFELATASMELNYLAAYWTNADLLLPSGFPYHNAADNEEIRRRTIEVLGLYCTTPRSWNEFLLITPGRFQEAWLTSRTEAARKAYLYHLYHRLVTLISADQVKWRAEEQNSISELLRDTPTHGSTAKRARVPSATRPQPEVILIDDVSRSLGNPDLENYVLAFRSGRIDAWVRRDATIAKVEATDKTTQK